MIIDETPDVDGWAQCVITEDDGCVVVRLSTSSLPAMRVWLDQGCEFGPDALAAIGRTFSAWAAKCAELGVTL